MSEHSNNELSSSGSANFEFQFRVHRFIEFIVKPVSGEPFKVDERYNGAIDKTLAIELSTSHNHQQILFSEQKIIVILRKVGLSRYSRYLSKQISYAANKVWMNKRCENMGLKVEVWDRITYVHDEQETMERVMLETREEYVLVPLSEEAIEKLERIEFRLDNDYGCSDSLTSRPLLPPSTRCPSRLRQRRCPLSPPVNAAVLADAGALASRRSYIQETDRLRQVIEKEMLKVERTHATAGGARGGHGARSSRLISSSNEPIQLFRKGLPGDADTNSSGYAGSHFNPRSVARDQDLSVTRRRGLRDRRNERDGRDGSRTRTKKYGDENEEAGQAGAKKSRGGEEEEERNKALGFLINI
ncbi:hypothetical protein Syun_023726 [Stephania yunnanensis]|uniref:Uncharacterized protein n=1 Tax=Stephania yunnanensis TaxID=152371 RepID=A0AAP0I3M0_9MAGN